MTRTTRAIIAAGSLALPLLLGAMPAQAQDQARYLAATCANCHGTDGRSAGGGGMPNAFRSGARQATIMHQLAKGYTDEQIAQLADFFSQQKK